MSRIVILAPLLPEARALAPVVSLGRGFAGRAESNDHFAIVMIGPRAPHLSSVQALAPRAIVLAGLGGGLSPTLALGDLVIDQPLHLPDLGFPIHHGSVHTSQQVVTNPRDKMTMFQQTSALAVDMENAPCRSLAKQLNVPFLTLRAISDTASESLDPEFLGLVDQEGRPRTARALALLARNPSKLPSLLHIGKATKLALSHLAAGLRAVLDSGWPDTPPTLTSPPTSKIPRADTSRPSA